MKTEIKLKWIAALRSGNYSQARQRLRKENSYCCLGVLCDLYQKETGIGKWNGLEFYINASSSSNLPPNEVVHWAGLSEANPRIESEMACYSNLASANDGGVTFKDIADIIEKQL